MDLQRVNGWNLTRDSCGPWESVYRSRVGFMDDLQSLRRRIALFEVEASSAPGSEQIRLRRQYWCAHRKSRVGAAVCRILENGPVSEVALWITVGFVLWMATWISYLLSAVGLFGIVLLLLANRSKSRRERYCVLMRGGRCPRCQYDLRNLLGEDHSDLIASSLAGPARCPECGYIYPLVPPPIA
jgi:hypothetical protein